MTMPAIETTQETPPKLRWYQYRLRSLMTLVIFIGLFTAAWTYSHKAERQAVQLKQAEKKIQTLEELIRSENLLHPSELRSFVSKARRLEIGDPEEAVVETLGAPDKKFNGSQVNERLPTSQGQWLPARTTGLEYSKYSGVWACSVYVFLSDGKVLGVRADIGIHPLACMQPF